ncbi:PAS domain S-box protein [Myxococcaceae bacterium GXIMD 01537]
MVVRLSSEPSELALAGGSALLDAVQAMVMVLDVEGRILRFNRYCESVTGLSNSEVHGRRVEELALAPPGASEQERGAFSSLSLADLPVSHVGVWCGRDGRCHDIEWTCTAFETQDHASRYIVCTGVDVTGRSRAQRELQEQLHFLQTLIDSMPSPVFFKSVDGLYRGCNRAFEEMLGRKRQDIVGKSVRELSPSQLAERYEQKDLELFQNPGLQQYEWAVRFASGEVHDVIFYKATYTDSGGALTGLVGVILDITDRKRIERALQQARDELEERVRQRTAQLEAADQAKSEFLNIASHELRTPLTALRLVLQKSQRGLAAGTPVPESSITRMERYADRLTRMAGDLLDASRLERGTLQIQHQSFDLSALVRDVVEDFRLQWPGRSLDVRLPRADAPVSADRHRIEQVLANLLDNASKYTPSETPVRVQVEVLPARVRVSIRDEGPGIAPQDQERLFKRFQRLASSIHQPGLGLGLYISREIIERHGGTLGMRSEPGNNGAEFFFELPLEG